MRLRQTTSLRSETYLKRGGVIVHWFSCMLPNGVKQHGADNLECEFCRACVALVKPSKCLQYQRLGYPFKLGGKSSRLTDHVGSRKGQNAEEQEKAIELAVFHRNP